MVRSHIISSITSVLIKLVHLGTQSLFVQRLPVQLIPKSKLDPSSQVPCRLCKKTVVLKKMRDHVAAHILRFMQRGEELEEGLLEEVCQYLHQ